MIHWHTHSTADDLEKMKLNASGRQKLGRYRSPESRHSIPNYSLTYWMLRKREPFITLGSFTERGGGGEFLHPRYPIAGYLDEEMAWLTHLPDVVKQRSVLDQSKLDRFLVWTRHNNVRIVGKCCLQQSDERMWMCLVFWWPQTTRYWTDSVGFLYVKNT